jgi:hypothetical protein
MFRIEYVYFGRSQRNYHGMNQLPQRVSELERTIIPPAKGILMHLSPALSAASGRQEASGKRETSFSAL